MRASDADPASLWFCIACGTLANTTCGLTARSQKISQRAWQVIFTLHELINKLSVDHHLTQPECRFAEGVGQAGGSRQGHQEADPGAGAWRPAQAPERG